jgi:hypothetical protein
MDANEKNVVKLVGTECWGVEERDQYWTTVTYTAKEPEPNANDAVSEALDDLKDEITGVVCQLTDLLSRLRRLRVRALDGDADAIAEAEGILHERSLIDDESICDMEGDVEMLEELVAERTEARDDVTVEPDTIETTVRDIALPYIEAGEYVKVETRNVNLRDHVLTGAIIRVQRDGHYVTISVFPQVKYSPLAPPTTTPVPPDATVESLYQKLVETKGELNARAILNAVQVVAKSTEMQLALLWKAVAA